MADTLELSVTGMTCDHCVHAVTNAILSVPGVTGAVVNLSKKSATVEGRDVDVDGIVAAIAEEGYESAPR